MMQQVMMKQMMMQAQQQNGGGHGHSHGPGSASCQHGHGHGQGGMMAPPDAMQGGDPGFKKREFLSCVVPLLFSVLGLAATMQGQFRGDHAAFVTVFAAVITISVLEILIYLIFYFFIQRSASPPEVHNVAMGMENVHYQFL